MITRNVKLYLTGGFPVLVPVSQFDTAWQFVFTIIKDSITWTIPSGATAVLNGLKPDGNVFAFAGAISGNTVTVNCDVQMTAVAGDTICELSILADGKTVGTANFTLAVEKAPKSPDDVSSDSTLPAYEEMLEQMENVGVIKFPSTIKSALLACFRNAAWSDTHAQEYYNDLFAALYGGDVVSISAVFVQGQNVVYTHDDLDKLRQYLVVTAQLESDTTVTVDDYELDGELTAGTSTITVTYEDKTTTFDVNVTTGIPSGYTVYDYIRAIGTTTLTNRAKATWIIMEKYANLNALSFEFAVLKLPDTDPNGGPAVFGRRSATGAASSLGFYTKGSTVGYHLHGDESSNEAVGFSMGVVHIVKYTNTNNSPSSLQVDDNTPSSITWVNNNILNLAPVLLANPVNDDNTTINVYNQVGYIKVFNLDNDLVGHYFAVVRKSDNRIGLYDLVNNVFYTTSTASYSTIGNSSCMYEVGNWS